jgi:hypothetical protein
MTKQYRLKVSVEIEDCDVCKTIYTYHDYVTINGGMVLYKGRESVDGAAKILIAFINNLITMEGEEYESG